MSRLTVGTIEGSAANNKVITIPSGTKIQTSAPGTIIMPGMTVQTKFVRLDTALSISVPGGTNSVEVEELRLNITPLFANSLIHCQWFISGEGSTYDMGYRIRVNGVEPSDGYNTDAGNVNWSFIASDMYDGNNDSTPRLTPINYFHYPGSIEPINYSPSLSGSSTGALTMYINRTVASAGTNGYERGVSWGIIHEIAQGDEDA